ncbi:MAG: hypothetical protein A3J47_00200 [Candidatus Yanofskybacteria bacterium RIFCSPHIGHO2_02_FULL_43_22]|uniref:DUF5659 domain-containing protein n=1 Tax=Candidatus Yanofskybacteria bacterium RIFCSPHIGHO2_02_FULL_43_22 TaxID=1802681 RepID=A0A1F8FR59_9BACT|nr:MAG: hypothetical protein A3J47_00200 [Candidatus Yanofskybacteria bacterium RIFCSPHIGHO2_02_FULL_43_22]
MAKENHIPEEDYKYIPLDPEVAWTTYDLGVSAALMCIGFELLSVNRDKPHKSLFAFRRANGIEEAVDLYWSDKLEVKARSFFDAIKALKNRLYSSD